MEKRKVVPVIILQQTHPDVFLLKGEFQLIYLIQTWEWSKYREDALSIKDSVRDLYMIKL